MFLKSIHLKSFRNIKDQNFDLNPKFNLLIGANAQGKTNVVEAAYLFATGKSFRTSEFRDMMMWNANSTHVDSETEGSLGYDNLRVTLNDAKKEFFKNGKRIRPGTTKGLCAVLFAPEEILLLRGQPAARRKHIDTLISQVFPVHGMLTKKYSKIVFQRNKLLQDKEIGRSTKIQNLKPWNQQLIDVGSKLICERTRWLDLLNTFLPDRYFAIAKNDGEAKFIYKPALGEEVLNLDEDRVRSKMEERLREREEDELIRGTSLVGPHRDDVRAVVGNREMKVYGSQGQHRTFTLALKISEMDFIKAETGETPVLILDDVASELDENRNKFLFEYLRGIDGQVFITATDDKDVRLLPGQDLSVFGVKSGEIEPRKPSNINACADLSS